MRIIPGWVSCLPTGGSGAPLTCRALRPASHSSSSTSDKSSPAILSPRCAASNVGEVGEGLLRRQDYFSFFRYFSNSSNGRQLITLPFSTQARLACEMPYFMKARARSSWASVSIVMLTPAPTASRT
jgi:hypothetical protein